MQQNFSNFFNPVNKKQDNLQQINNQNFQYQQQESKQQNKKWTFKTSEPPYAKNLSSTRTEYHNYIPEYVKNVKAKNYIDYGIYIVIFIFWWLFSGTIIFPVVLLVSSIILIMLGFKKYTIYNILVNTPISKIHVATYGLNKVRGRFIPYGRQPLKSPISGQDCIYYSISTWYIHKVSRGNSEYWESEFIDSFAAGIPALFADETGFLAVDLEKAPNIEVRTNIIEIQPYSLATNTLGLISTLAIKKISDDVLSYVKQAASMNTQVNLFNMKNYGFRLEHSKTRDLKRYVTASEVLPSEFNIGAKIERTFMPFRKHYYIYLVEQYIPINEDYIIVGGFADTGKMINMKPVKVTVPDMSTGILGLFLANTYTRGSINMGGRTIKSSIPKLDDIIMSILSKSMGSYGSKFFVLALLNIISGIGLLIWAIMLLIKIL